MTPPLDPIPSMLDNDQSSSATAVSFARRSSLSPEEAGILDAKSALTEVRKIIKAGSRSR